MNDFTATTTNSKVGMIAGYERNKGEYSLVLIAPNSDTRSSQDHINEYRLEASTQHEAFIAMRTAQIHGATPDRYDIGEGHYRIYFNGRALTRWQLDNAVMVREQRGEYQPPAARPSWEGYRGLGR